MTYDYIIRPVDGYGFLPIIKDWNEDGKELYRGEFKDTATDALIACLEWANRNDKSILELMEEIKVMSDDIIEGSKKLRKERV